MQQFTKVVLACDESGAKGYADQNETYPGEVGVFAGIMVPETHMPTVDPVFKAIYDRYKPAAGKLHITDLDDASKANLRQEIYDAITRLQLPCFWYAIHVAGLHDFHMRLQTTRQMAKEMTEEARGEKLSRVKRGSPREEPASMHVELFAGLYGHLIAFLEERKRRLLEIEIRSDQIDSPIIKKFVSVAERLLSDDPALKTVTGFDTIENRVVTGSISVKVQLPLNIKIEAIVQELTIVPIGEGDGLVLAADVLANSLNYHFRNRPMVDLYKPLNSPAAIVGHPLAMSLDAFRVWGVDLVGDGVYRHPLAP